VSRSVGTCLTCVQGVTLRRDGTTRVHFAKVVYGPHWLATVRCPGSGEEPSEDLGVVWDSRPHRRCFVCQECLSVSDCKCREVDPSQPTE
jgi:hypothetical protein